MAKAKQKDLIDRLHAQGLRKKVASSVADAIGSGPSKKPPAAVKRAAADLRNLAAEIEDRATGQRGKRQTAAKKAAATRKRNAAKRSQTAKKAARTRAAKS
jgi:hypothetical protein